MKIYKTQMRYWFCDTEDLEFYDLTKSQLNEHINFDIQYCMDRDITPRYTYGPFSKLTIYEDGTEEFIEY